MVYIAIRIIEMHRILKDTGSIYFHCDHTMNYHIRTLLDLIFGYKNFKNEIIWCYKTGGSSKKAFNNKHDTIVFYAKSNKSKFNYKERALRGHSLKKVLGSITKKIVDEEGRKYRETIRNGKRYRYYADEGKLISDYWTDISSHEATNPLPLHIQVIHSEAGETIRTHYKCIFQQDGYNIRPILWMCYYLYRIRKTK